MKKTSRKTFKGKYASIVHDTFEQITGIYAKFKVIGKHFFTFFSIAYFVVRAFLINKLKLIIIKLSK